MPIHSVPTAESLRELIDEVMQSDVDFDAFCVDYFAAVHRRFAAGMEHSQKVSLLLMHANRREILECLCARFPKRATLDNWHGRMKWENVETGAGLGARRRRRRRLQDILLGAALSDWLRRLWGSLSPEVQRLVLGVIILLFSGYGFARWTSLPVTSSLPNATTGRGRWGAGPPKVPMAPMIDYMLQPPGPESTQP